MLQFVAVCCSLLQCAVVCYIFLQICCSVLQAVVKVVSEQYIADTHGNDIDSVVCCSGLQMCCRCVAVCCSLLQCVAVCCIALQRFAVRCSEL